MPGRHDCVASSRRATGMLVLINAVKVNSARCDRAIVINQSALYSSDVHTHTHTHPFNGPFSGTTQVSRYEKGKTNLDFTEARDSEWQWHQLGHMQVCTLLQTDNHASTPPLSFLQAGCPSCRPTNSVKALKAYSSDARHQKCSICGASADADIIW